MSYKILLVDDEPWVIEDIKSLIDYQSLGYTIIGEANDGVEAIAFIKQKKPDIIISDIKMPNISGLELLKLVNAKYRDIVTIFVSAFSEFELAKQAVALGASGYLLKPVDKKELSDILIKASGVICQRKADIRNAIKLMLIEYINRIMEDDETPLPVSQLAKAGFDISDKFFYVAVIKRKGTVTLNIENYFDSEAIISFPIGEKRDFILISNMAGKKLQHSKLIDIMRWADRNKATIGVSQKLVSLNQLGAGFEEANIMLEQHFMTGKEEGVYFYRKPNGTVKFTLPPKNELAPFINSLHLKLKNKKISAEGALQIYNQIITVTMPDDDMTIKDSKSLIDTYSDVNEMISFLSGTLASENIEPSRANEQLTECVEYIHNNYDKKLLINNLAKQFYFNSSYLSVLFKNYTGRSFTNYLMELRFNKAKELLNITDLSLNKISEMVGYENYFHFSKLFKKYEGISPSDYRKNK